MPIYWRPQWRAFTSLLLVLVPVAIFVGFILLTWFPDSEPVDDARGVPLVGPLIGRLQDHYRRPPEVPTEGSDDEPDVIVHVVHHPREPRRYIWATAGASLRSEPTAEAESLAVVDAFTNLFVNERRGDWVRVRLRGTEGWMLAPKETRVAGIGPDRPAPVLPVVPHPPDREVLERAVAAFPAAPKLGRLEPYLVYSDGPGEVTRKACGALIRDAESLYEELYGVEPVGEAAEAILLFARQEDYFRFAGADVTRSRTGHAGRGFVATFVGGRTTSDICRTLLHEIAHLLNWRSLGPALPPWLTEGLAVNFELQARGEGLPYRALSRAALEGRFNSFEVLAGLDYDRFHAADGTGAHYAASGLWIRYLSTDASVSDGFGFFLDYLSRGGPWAKNLRSEDFLEVRTTPSLADDLLYFLGSDYERLEAGFTEWLRSRG